MRLHPSENIPQTDLPAYKQHVAIIKELTRLNVYDKDTGWLPESRDAYRRLLSAGFGLSKIATGFTDGDGI